MKESDESLGAQYLFLFATKKWLNLYDFETFLGKCFESAGVDGIVVNAQKGGSNGFRIVRLVDKPQEIVPSAPPQPAVSAGEKLKQMTGPQVQQNPKGRMSTGILQQKDRISVPAMNFKKGKFLPNKGYLKR